MQDFLYNGKEYETTEDLNWYFYGARWYDPAIGRFTGVDPIAAEFAHVSGYNYAENSPIAYIDLWGLQRALPNGQSGPFTDAYADKEWEAANANSSGETLPTYTITENQLPLSERTVGSLTPRQVWGKDAQIYDLGARRQAEYIQAVFNPETVGWAGGMMFLTGGPSRTPRSFTPRFNPQRISWVNRHGNLTDGTYTVSKDAMSKHLGGYQGKSTFYPTLNAEEAVLKAAQHADKFNLWTKNSGTKASVKVLNTNIGTTGSGKPTNIINVYKNSNGTIHGTPGTPR